MFTKEEMIVKLMMIPGILLGFVLHEFAHAITADRLGDPTPRSQGRLTLDPRAHIDWLGFIMIIVFTFGWAKPVMTNPRYYKKPKRDDILVSLAGPFMNLLLAIILLIIAKIYTISGVFSSNYSLQQNISSLLIYSSYINVVLFILNLIPIPSFDGYHVISNIFNTWKYRFFTILEQYSMIIFIVLVVSGIFGKILNPLVTVVWRLLTNNIF
jgi:Zn-dependent protease